jgi:hypothetical protein
LLPTETATLVTPDSFETSQQIIYDHIAEAKIALLAEFLDRCSADFTPYKAVETIYYIGNSVVPRGAVHEIHQLRLADSFYGRQAYIQSDNQHDLDVLAAAISSGIFELYAGLADSDSNLGSVRARYPWLEIPIARGKIKDTLVKFMTVYFSANAASSAPLLARMELIIAGLDNLHDKNY